MGKNEEERCLEILKEALRAMREAKPEGRSELARCYAVSITEMEKVVAYFKMFVLEQSAPTF